MKKQKVIFMGTPDFCVPILNMLIDKYDVIGVVTQPDKFVGRKKILTPSPVKKIALDNNIKVMTPFKIRDDYKEIIDLNPDIIITCAYGQIVPTDVLNCPKYGCINVHASLLPKYRGGAPIQRAIMNGEVKTGITIMYMNAGLDTGDMICKKEVLISNNDNYDSLCDKLMVTGCSLLDETLPDIFKGNIKREIQNNDDASYASIISREDEKIDFNRTSFEIYNQIRALSSNPGAYAIINDKVVKIYSSYIRDHVHLDAANGEIVKVYDDGIGISTKDSELVITDIKIEGKNRISVKSYLNGRDKDSLIGKVFK